MKNKFSILAFIFSTVSIIVCVILNYNLAKLYVAADGKTKALFGIIELSRLDYKIWVFIGGLLAFILSVIAIKKKENKTLYYSTLILSFISIILVFIRFWKWMT